MSDQKKPEKPKVCGLIVRYSGPNGGTRHRCTKPYGHKGECSAWQ